MREIYEKIGLSIRLERSAESSWLIQLDERGFAERNEASFTARSASIGPLPAARPTRSEVESLAARIMESIPPRIVLERMTVVAGLAVHRMRKGRSRAEWRERSVRVHISLANPLQKARAWIDLGGRNGRSISIDPIHRIADALARLGRSRPTDFPLLRLEPAVAATLWPSLLTHAAMRVRSRGASRLKIVQLAPDDETRDGNGDAIATGPLLQGGILVPTWPNVFRPSYRLPPRPAPMHVRASTEGAHEGDVPAAVGLVQPPTMIDDRLRLTLLVDVEGRTRVASIDMPVRDWVDRIVSIGEDLAWFPFGGGSWGATTILEKVRLARGS